MSDQGTRKVSEVHISILKTKRFLRQEESTAAGNLAIMHELPQWKWKIRRELGVYVLEYL